MSKDPKVIKAQVAKTRAQSSYDAAREAVLGYCEAKGFSSNDVLNGHVDDPYAKKLAETYWDANEELRTAYLDYNDVAKRYGVKPSFSFEYTRHW